MKWSANRNGSMITAGYRVERMLCSTIDELINFMVRCARLCVCVLCWNWVRHNHIVGHTHFFSWHRKIGKVESNHPSFGFFICQNQKHAINEDASFCLCWTKIHTESVVSSHWLKLWTVFLWQSLALRALLGVSLQDSGNYYFVFHFKWQCKGWGWNNKNGKTLMKVKHQVQSTNRLANIWNSLLSNRWKQF